MKECPKCHNRNPNDFTYCVSCGYIFPVTEKDVRGERFGTTKGVLVLFLIVVNLVPSSCCILSAVSNTNLWLSDEFPCDSSESYYCADHDVDPTIDNPQSRFFGLAVGLLVGGSGVYSLIITRGFTYWRDLSWGRKAIVITSVVAGVVLAMLGVCAWLLSATCWRD